MLVKINEEFHKSCYSYCVLCFDLHGVKMREVVSKDLQINIW